MTKKILSRLRAAAVLCIACAALGGAALADGPLLIPVGQTVGIQMSVDGVLVAGVCEVETAEGPLSPAQRAGVRAGDVIVSLDGCAVGSAEELSALVADNGTRPVRLELERDGRTHSVSVTPVCDPDGRPRLGLWLRDGISGIGTVTYIDPDSGAFGALGHGVTDMDAGTLLPVQSGAICPAQIVDVRRGEAGAPGELSGSFSVGDTLGRIEKNTQCGIFGTMCHGLPELHEAVEVAEPAEVEEGPATILACVAGRQAREYEVRIARTGLAAGDGRDLTVRVTDPALLAATGGIVQGMSGSPILQNGKLVGAVTHVLVSTPEQGYGIFARRMLDAAGTFS